MDALLFERLCGGAGWTALPEALREGLAASARLRALTQLLRKNETLALLEAMAAQKVRPLLIKGFALAHSLYPSPALRPSLDVDWLIRSEDRPRVEAALRAAGYEHPNAVSGELISHQAAWRRQEAGIDHAHDFHWKISNPAIFSDLLTYDELSARARPVPALGPHARMPSWEDALLLACVHRIAHHYDDDRLVWLYDLHRLLPRLDAAARERFVFQAHLKKVSAVCERGIRLAEERFGPLDSEALLTALAAGRGSEPSSVYLRGDVDKPWRQFYLNIRNLPSARERLLFFKEMALPPAEYMLKKYSIKTPILLPFLYLWRIAEGLFKWGRRLF